MKFPFGHRPTFSGKLLVSGSVSFEIAWKQSPPTSCDRHHVKSKASIAAGRVTVDGQAVKSEHVLRDGQLIVFGLPCFLFFWGNLADAEGKDLGVKIRGDLFFWEERTNAAVAHHLFKNRMVKFLRYKLKTTKLHKCGLINTFIKFIHFHSICPESTSNIQLLTVSTFFRIEVHRAVRCRENPVLDRGPIQAASC